MATVASGPSTNTTNTGATNPDEIYNTTASGAAQGFAGQGGFSTGNPATASPGSYHAPAASDPTWTNLNAYLAANQNAGQTEAQQIAQSVGQQSQTAQQALAQNVADFQNQYSSVPTVAQAQSNIANILGQSQSDTTGSSNVNQYQNYLNQNYGAAPTSLSDVNNASGQNDWFTTQNDYNNAGTALQNTQSAAGQQTLLQQQYGTGANAYNQGDSILDQYLLQGSPNAQAALNEVYNQYAPGIVTPANSSTGTAPDLGNALLAAQQFASTEKSNEATIASDAQAALQAQIKADTAQVNNEYNTAVTNNDTSYTNLLSDIQNNNPDPADLQALGLTQGEALYGVNPASFVSAQNPINSSMTATAQDYINQQALEALAAGQTYAQQATLGLNGTAPEAMPAAYTVNQPALQAAITTAQAAYQQSMLSDVEQAMSNNNMSTPYTTYQQLLNAGDLNPQTWQNFINAAQANPAAVSPAPVSAMQQIIQAINAVNAEYGGGPADTFGPSTMRAVQK